MYTRKSGLAALLLTVFSPSSAFAGDALLGANLVALGGASVANTADNASIASNPAMLALSQRYDFSGTFFGQLDGDLGWNLNATDSSKGIVAIGAGWERTVENPPLTDDELPGWTEPGVPPVNFRKTSIFSVGIGVATRNRVVSFGLGGSFGTVKHERLGQQLTGDIVVGMGLQPSDFVAIGLSVEGMLPVKGPAHIPFATLAGVRFAVPNGPSLALDAGWQFQDAYGLGLIVRAGAEAAIGVARPRLGFAYDGPRRTPSVTGGLGGENEAGALDFGVDVPFGTDFGVKRIRAVLTIRMRT